MFKRMINLCLVFVMLFAIFQLDYVSAETDFDAIGNQLLRTEGIKVTDAIMLNLLEYTIKVNDAIGIPTDIESLLDDLAVDRVDKVLPGFEKIVDVYELFTKSIYAYKDYYKAASGVPSAVEEVLRAAEDTIETGIEKQVNLIGSIYHVGVGHRNTNESIPTDSLKDADRVLKNKRFLDVIYENADLTLIKYFAPSVRTKMLKLAEDYENFIDNTPSALSIYNLGRYGSKNGPDELNILAEEIPADKVITSSQIETAIAWATNKMNNDDGTYINYCLKFVGDAWKQANITTKSYGWAKLAADDMVKYSDKNPPRGAVVFYDYYNTIGGVSRNWGHAAISLGNGKIIHALNTGIKITNIDMGSNMPYLGWGVWDNRILATAPVPPETPGEPEEPKEIKLQDLPKFYLSSSHKFINNETVFGVNCKFGIKATGYDGSTFYLGEEFNSLNFKLVGKKATVEVIDGDNGVVLREVSTTNTDTVKEVNVDVRGIDELEIYFGGSEDDFIIAEPYLHRDKITTEGSLITHKELYDETKPNLFQVGGYSDGSHKKYKDSDHLEHKGIKYKFGIKAKYGYGMSIFELGEEFTSLNFKLAGKKATVEVIDGDNGVVLREVSTTNTDTVKEVNVDVRGIDNLEIYFGGSEDDFIIAEPYLHRDKITTEGSLITHKELYDKTKPNLFQVGGYSDGSHKKYKDSDHLEHKGIKYKFGIKAKYGYGMSIFELGEEFTSLNFKLVGKKATVEVIDGDNGVVLKEVSTTNTDTVKEVNVDVRGIDNLEIYFGGSEDDFIIAEPYLHRDKITTEGSLITHKELYDKTKPNLFQVGGYSDGSHKKYKDSDHLEHKGIKYKFGIKAKYGYGMSIFELGEEFTSLNFKLVGKKATVEVIDGDNGVVLKEVSTTNTDTVKEVNVDVRGIDKLEIYFGGSEDDFIIAEPYLDFSGTEDSEEPGEPIIDKGRYTLEEIAEAYANYVSTFWRYDREQVLKKLPKGAELPNKWCSAFIGQTAEAFGLSKIIPLNPGVGGLYRDILSLKGNSAKGFYFVEKDKYNVENSTYTNRDNFIPKVGDLVIFKWNDAGSNITFSHVGIVTKVENPEKITVIHGNTDKSDVGKWYPLNFRKNNSEVVAFVRPNYGAISDEWTGKIKHSFECPVDVCVIFDGEELNSATDSTVTSFGTMTIEEDCITVILDYGNPYNIVVTGKDEGTMKLTTEFDTNHGQNTRSFIDIPITKNTTIHVYADAATAGIELLVEPNDAETTETIWYAEPGDTVEKENEELTNELLDESWTENIIISIEEDRTAIDTDGGTLQLIADIFPEREIEWTVEPITGEAVIDQNGLLTAIKNGTVTVTAATKDGSDIKESIDITISNQTEWKTWESKYDIALDKTWTVEFNKILDAATVKGSNIYVTDQNNQVVSTSLYQQNNKKVCVIPTKNYQSGHTYILWIKGLKAEDGSLLGENVKMEFTIK